MNYNPYAPPAAPAGPSPGAPIRGGEPQPWETSEVIKAGWEIYKTHWAPMTFGILVGMVIGSVPGQVAPGLMRAGVLEQNSGAYWAVEIPLSLLGQLIAQFFAAGMTRAAIRAARENTVTFGDFFNTGGRYLSYLGMSFLRTVAILLGFVLLIVPGLILSLGLVNADFYVMDQGLGPIEALKKSWESTDGQKGNIFIFALAEVGITIVGLVACCLGIFVAVPVCLLARAILYMRMSGTGPTPTSTYAQGPQVGIPGGGYGGYGGGPPGY